MSCFSGVLNQSDAFASLNRAWTTGSRPVGAVGLSETGKALVLHALYEQQKKPLLVLTPDEASAVKLTEDLRTLQGDVLLYPAREMNFVQVAGASHEYELLRLDVLSRMAAGAYTAVVAPVAAACQLTMPPAELLERTRTVQLGDDVPPGQLVQALVAAGYARYDQVDGTSQFALRGGILDIFPPGRTEPVRLEFWGDTIESMTAFDLATQRRTEALNSLRITPSAEVLFADAEKTAKAIEALAAGLRGKATKAREKLLTDADTLRKTGTLSCKDKYLPLVYQSNGLFDYCNGLLAVCDSAKVKEKCNNANRLLQEDMKWLVEQGSLCKGLDRYTVDFDTLTEIYTEKKALYLDSMPRGSFDTPVGHLSDFRLQTLGVWSGTMAQLTEELRPLAEKKYTVCLLAGTERAGRALATDLQSEGFSAEFYPRLPEQFQTGTVHVCPGSLSGGVQISDIRFALFTHARTGQSKRSTSVLGAKTPFTPWTNCKKATILCTMCMASACLRAFTPWSSAG